MTDLQDQLYDAIQSALTDEMVAEATKKMRSAIEDVESRLEYSIKCDLASNLSGWVFQMAKKAITAMLEGDEQEFRKALQCVEGRYNGRTGNDLVIGGELFEYGCTVTRKKLVDAYPEILKSERILDLEGQLASTVKQVARLESDLNRRRSDEG